MNIEHFVAQSEGQWKSMRTGHSLAFQQFEQVLSQIKIQSLSPIDPDVLEVINRSGKLNSLPVSPFRITWEAESDWDPDENHEASKGSCVLIPFPKTSKKGKMLRSLGYSEPIQTLSNYSFLILLSFD